MDSAELQHKIIEFKNTIFENNHTSINKANTLVSDIILTAAKKSLQYRKTQHKRKTKCIKKKWFNSEYERARKFVKLASKKKHADPSNIKERKVFNNAENQCLTMQKPENQKNLQKKPK